MSDTDEHTQDRVKSRWNQDGCNAYTSDRCLDMCAEDNVRSSSRQDMLVSPRSITAPHPPNRRMTWDSTSLSPRGMDHPVLSHQHIDYAAVYAHDQQTEPHCDWTGCLEPREALWCPVQSTIMNAYMSCMPQPQ